MDKNELLFEEIMLQIGNDGRYQKLFNYVYNLIFVVFGTMASLNMVLALAVPDHWCNVPGRELTNYSIEEWKLLHIPWTNSSLGQPKFDKCLMYDNNRSLVGCIYGWEYDKTWYTETFSSKQNWVCENEMYITNSFTISKIGEIAGTFLLGQMSDQLGRKPAFYTGLTTLIIGRLLMVVTNSTYMIFIISLIISGLSSMAIYQSPLIIGMEISKEEDRSLLSFMQCFGWTIGLSTIPFIFWYIGHWKPFIIGTILPLVPFLFFYNFMIESPRWLASQGKLDECFKQLKKIAKVNSTKLDSTYLMKLKKLENNVSTNYTTFSLFSTWKMAKVTLKIIIGWAAYSIIYMILYLNVTNLAGNPFINFFFQSVAELPGYYLGKYFCDFIGRKFTRLGSYFLVTIGSFFMLVLIEDSRAILIISVILRICISVAFYAVNLQSLEMYPTSIRQSGSSLGAIVGNVLSLLSPYIVYLGTTQDSRYPYIIIACLAMVGGLCGISLPETLHQKLPETIEEVENLGKGMKFWSIPRSNKDCEHTIIYNKA